MITALAGGVGASKFLDGLYRSIDPKDISIIVNTGDDIELFGLYIAPDLDIVTYTLAGIVNPATGWGINEDTFECIDRLTALTGGDRWFNLGDGDLATHIFRTEQMRKGHTLTEVSDAVRKALGVKSQIFPMTDLHTPTTIITDDGEMHFQEYLIKRRAEPRVRGIRSENIESSRPAYGVADAILNSEAIIICPSNPLISIGPILAVPGIRDLLRKTHAKIAAISPIVGGKSLKGPSDRMLSDLSMEVSARQVAHIYSDFLDIFIIDNADSDQAPEIEELGLKVVSTDTVMNDNDKKRALARAVLTSLE